MKDVVQYSVYSKQYGIIHPQSSRAKFKDERGDTNEDEKKPIQEAIFGGNHKWNQGNQGKRHRHNPDDN